MECYGKYYYCDGLICSAGYDLEPPQGETTFYEVIRTFAGIPLFFNDHITRISDGIATRYSVPERLSENIIAGINALSECELIQEINIKIMVTFSQKRYSLMICYIPSFYPTEKMYEEGVKIILQNAERPNPEVKILNTKFRTTVNEELAEKRAYESLLVNNEGLITEGSRSNVFFVDKNNILFTAPDHMVLSGITRKYIIEICRHEGIEIHFEPVRASAISKYQNVFLTGTSPMVLPVESIGDERFRIKNPIVTRLREAYSEKAEESIRNYLTDAATD